MTFINIRQTQYLSQSYKFLCSAANPGGVDPDPDSTFKKKTVSGSFPRTKKPRSGPDSVVKKQPGSDPTKKNIDPDPTLEQHPDPTGSESGTLGRFPVNPGVLQ